MNNEIAENSEIEIGEKYLPIGTVVMLKGGKKRVMITGFCTIAQEQQDKMFDYSGCVYPEGFIDSNQICLFDHEQIDKVYHKGLVDEEETNFKTSLKTIIEKVGEENIIKQIQEDSKNDSTENDAQETTNIPEVPVSTQAPAMPEIPIATQAPAMPETSTIPNNDETTQF